MPEEGFSFLKIQRPENLTPHKPKIPPESCKFWEPPFIFSPPPPPHHSGGVVGAMID